MEQFLSLSNLVNCLDECPLPRYCHSINYFVNDYQLASINQPINILMKYWTYFYRFWYSFGCIFRFCLRFENAVTSVKVSNITRYMSQDDLSYSRPCQL